MNRRNTNLKGEIDRLILKQIGSEQNKLFLSRLPDFELQRGTPEKFQGLLADLEQAERRSHS